MPKVREGSPDSTGFQTHLQLLLSSSSLANHSTVLESTREEYGLPWIRRVATQERMLSAMFRNPLLFRYALPPFLPPTACTLVALSRRGQSPLESPPSPDCPRQNNRSPPTKYRSHTWSLPAADFGLFAIAFATALAYGEQPGHCPFNQNKVRQHQLKSLQDGEMTPLPLKKNRRNGCRVKTWNTIQVRCICRMLNSLGTSIMRDWPPIRVRKTPVYASSLHS